MMKSLLFALIGIFLISKCTGYFSANTLKGKLAASFHSIARLHMSTTEKYAQTRMQTVFGNSKTSQLVAYITAGYPHPSETADLLLAMEAGGANIIELGVPFTDPQADGATIQRANEVALSHKVNLRSCLDMVKEARSRGLTVPVVLMAKAAGVDGFIVVDLSPEEGRDFIQSAQQHHLSYIPLVSPTTTNERIKFLSDAANGDKNSFIYIVSIAGITGARSTLSDDLPQFIARVRENTDKPLAIGFGISTPDQVKQVSELGDGVVVGSAIINNIDSNSNKSKQERAQSLKEFVATLSAATASTAAVQRLNAVDVTHSNSATPEASSSHTGRVFGEFGGRYIAETLELAHNELADAYDEAMKDPAFHEQLAFYRKEFIGGPTPLYFAENLSKNVGGANIYFKREELAHTGAHKINNAVGQVLLAKRLGKTRIIAETGAGQHGVATAAVCAKFNLPCTIYMGAKDCERQKLNVFRMQTLGAKVVPVEAGSRTLKDAINEAMRDWVSNIYDTHYLIGSAIGAHPFPLIVRDLQSVMGREARAQMLDRVGKLPDAVVACVGGGSNAIGIFHPFVDDKEVQLFGAEAGGDLSTVTSGTSGKGVDSFDSNSGAMTSATLSFGSPGVLHGTRTYLLQDNQGNILKTRSISAGLDYPGVGPEHSFLKDSHRAVYKAVSDAQALEAFLEVSRTEGIIPALEPAHALYLGMQIARDLGKGKDILINISGRGDKDMMTVAKHLGVEIN